MVSINTMPWGCIDILNESPSELAHLKAGASVSKSEKYWCWPPFRSVTSGHGSEDMHANLSETELNLNPSYFIDFPDPAERLIGFYTLNMSESVLFE